MITDTILSFSFQLFGYALGMIPDSLSVPGFLDSALGATLGLMLAATSLSVWVPMPAVIAAAGFRMFVLLGALGAKSLRMIVSLFTGGGGSAA